VSFQGRDITNKQKTRYKACNKEDEAVFHKDILYNLDNCQKETIVVVEGIFDAVRIGNDCAATFGTEWTIEQFILLRNRFKRIFVIYDNEREAQNKAIKLAMGLNALGKDVENFKLDGGDPADLSPDDVLCLRKELNI
jgi:DNA primase